MPPRRSQDIPGRAIRSPRDTQSASEWKRLFRTATSLIAQVNRDTFVIDHWTFGGGTAMMLQIGHRESHDVDIFLRDPQHLAFLNPATQNFSFDTVPTDYGGDGSGSLKLVFGDIGEIDFIVATALTDNPTIERTIEGVATLLETVPEIITKKVFYRGANLKPRDIFDLAAAGREFRNDVVQALKQYPEEVKSALSRIERLNPEFVGNAISDLMIREEFKGLVGSSLDDARKLLREVL